MPPPISRATSTAAFAARPGACAECGLACWFCSQGSIAGQRLGRERGGRLVIEIDHAANARAPRDTLRHSAMKASTSASVVDRPKLTRTTSREASTLQPIAPSTWLGFMLPDEQALPADTAIPAMSNRIN